MCTRTYSNYYQCLPLTIAVFSVLAGCEESTTMAGIDGGGAPDTPAASAVSVGEITGFGSVIVNGDVYSTAGATITIDGNPGSEADLRLGQIVVIEFDSGNSERAAISVATQDVVEARVESVNLAGASFSVLGQSVKAGGDTIFDGAGLADVSGLNPGMVVEVSGYSLSTGDITATRIEEKADNDEFEVTGRVENVNIDNRSFQINALIVDYSSATLNNFAGDIANGDIVEVKGSEIDDDGVVHAASVERLDGALSGSFESVEIEGPVTRFVSVTDFDVQNVPVTTNASTQFVGGVPADLALNVKVEVEGAPDGSGTLIAETVEFRAASNAKTEAFVSAVDASQNTLQVFSIDIDLSAATSYKDEGPLQLREFSLPDINVGDFVSVVGEENADRISASLVKRKSPEDRLKVVGTASNLSQPQFEVLGVTVATNAATDFEDDTGAPIDAATFFSVAEGRIVEIEGDDSGGTLVAAEVELKNR